MSETKELVSATAYFKKEYKIELWTNVDKAAG